MHPTALPRTGMSLVFTVGSRQRWIHVKCRCWMPQKCSKPTQETCLGVMKLARNTSGNHSAISILGDARRYGIFKNEDDDGRQIARSLPRVQRKYPEFIQILPIFMHSPIEFKYSDT